MRVHNESHAGWQNRQALAMAHSPRPCVALCLVCHVPRAEKFERMKAVVKRYVDKDMKALDAFPDGSQ